MSAKAAQFYPSVRAFWIALPSLPTTITARRVFVHECAPSTTRTALLRCHARSISTIMLVVGKHNTRPQPLRKHMHTHAHLFCLLGPTVVRVHVTSQVLELELHRADFGEQQGLACPRLRRRVAAKKWGRAAHHKTNDDADVTINKPASQPGLHILCNLLEYNVELRWSPLVRESVGPREITEGNSIPEVARWHSYRLQETSVTQSDF